MVVNRRLRMKTLFVSHWLVNVETLGPGKRMVLWFAGCSKDCPGCCAPKLQSTTDASECDPVELANFVNSKMKEYKLNGLTLSGGDPLEQDSEALELFLKHIETRDILLYTGYDLNEVKELPIYETLKRNIAVLKCGKYIKALDDNNILKGSSNQTITYFKEEYKKVYKSYISSQNRGLQIFYSGKEAFYAGLPTNAIFDNI